MYKIWRTIIYKPFHTQSQPFNCITHITQFPTWTTPQCLSQNISVENYKLYLCVSCEMCYLCKYSKAQSYQAATIKANMTTDRFSKLLLLVWWCLPLNPFCLTYNQDLYLGDHPQLFNAGDGLAPLGIWRWSWWMGGYSGLSICLNKLPPSKSWIWNSVFVLPCFTKRLARGSLSGRHK